MVSIPGVNAPLVVPGVSSPAAIANAVNWWVVTYVNPSLGSVAGAKAGPLNTNGQITGIEDQIYLSATTETDAHNAAQSELGSSVDIVSIAGPYATESIASNIVTTNTQKINQEASSGTLPKITIPNPLSGLEAIGNFFSILAEPNTWIRIAEIVIGVLLGAVVLDKLLEGTSVGDTIHKGVKAAGLAAVAA
jgi:hypothetical protein